MSSRRAPEGRCSGPYERLDAAVTAAVVAMVLSLALGLGAAVATWTPGYMAFGLVPCFAAFVAALVCAMLRDRHSPVVEADGCP